MRDPATTEIRPAVTPRRRIWRGIKILSLTALVLFLASVIAALAMSVFGVGAIDRLQGGLDALAFPLFVLRASIYALVLIFWEPLTRWSARRNGWSDAELVAALGRRNQMALWLLGFELLVSGSFLWRAWS